MPLKLSAEQISPLAPDAASLAAAKGLCKPSKWPLLAASDRALWGLCQGSGSKPYQTQVDRVALAYKCSCPSRKFPCKHALGLMLLFANEEAAFSKTSEADWVLAWLSSREEKAEKKSEKQAAQEAKLANDATGAGPAVVAKDNSKSIEKRLSKIQAGAKELELWLHDLLRRGLAELPAREPGYWQSMAARMVDAQAAGLARELSRLEACVSSRADWPLVFARRLGRLNLLLQGCQRFRELSPGLQADLRAQLGWAVDKQEVLTSGQRVADSWLVLGLRQWQEEKLFTRWVWLWGLSSGRSALIIDFSHGSSLFAQPFVVGTLQAGELAYYPSACPLRALLLESQASSMPAVAPAAAADLNQALASVAEARARNPWQEVHLLMVDSVRLLVSDGAFMAIDQQSCCLPLTLEPERLWRLVALAGGTPLRLCAEWEGETLRPLSVWIEEAMYVA